jgi:hypothetical protein
MAPSQTPPPPFGVRPQEPAKPKRSKSKKAEGPRLKVAPDAQAPQAGKGAGPATGGRKFRAAGSATSDALRPARDKQVPLEVRVPRSTRKQVRAVAKHSGASVDEIVVTALNDWLGDPRRW